MAILRPAYCYDEPMKKDKHSDYYAALLARDPKFDGKFFIGVKTTGVYCRPVCPARPKRENVEFFASALQAEKAGYRPCLRCRPESAPDSPLWHGSSAVVRRAVRVLLSEEGVMGLGEEVFAARFGMSARHLRRLFQEELGKTPAQIMRDNRLNLARKLIVESDLSFTDIAFSAGFDSVRRFNAAIRQRFARTPTELRRRKKSARCADGVIEFSAAYRPPLDWQACLDYYAKHKIGELECFDEASYTRVFDFEGVIGEVRVRDNPAKHQLDIALRIDNVNAIGFVLVRIKEMFDLFLDPLVTATAFENGPELGLRAAPVHGLRLVRCWDRFELAVSAILGQLVSVKQATALTQELMALYGNQQINPINGKTITLFPSAAVLAAQTLDALKVPRMKKTAISTLAQQVVGGDIHFSSYQSPQQFKEKLLAIRGIGHWTAEYIALRAIGDTDAFPPGDAYLNKRLAGVSLQGLSPWRGYLASALYKYGEQL